MLFHILKLSKANPKHRMNDEYVFVNGGKTKLDVKNNVLNIVRIVAI